MIEWGEKDKLVILRSLAYWLNDEQEFITSVQNAVSLSIAEKEALILNANQRIEDIKITVDKINEL